MKIQVIKDISNPQIRDNITLSPISAPRALDDYDINILDLSVASMWKYKYSTHFGQIDALPDLNTLQQMVTNKKRATIVYVMPQNVLYHYRLSYGTYQSQTPIKDAIDSIYQLSISKVIPSFAEIPTFAFEKTSTKVGSNTYESDFYWVKPREIITKSERSEKPTTIKLAENIYATTLEITKSLEDLKYYVSTLFEKHQHEAVPEWMKGIVFGDDITQNAEIEKCMAEIERANLKIAAAKIKLQENAKYKSILYTNGDELVEVVFNILEKILGCDLSSFVDNKKEDFLVKLPCCTFIGEIKGVTSNVKYEHISQVELHYRGYLDNLTESGASENVKQILIMNPFRTKPVDVRDPVHTAQIELAIRNGCLIIETNTLLRLYEKFCKGVVSTQQCIDVFSKRTGLLRLSDFDEDKEDNEPYKV